MTRRPWLRRADVIIWLFWLFSFLWNLYRTHYNTAAFVFVMLALFTQIISMQRDLHGKDALIRELQTRIRGYGE